MNERSLSIGVIINIAASLNLSKLTALLEIEGKWVILFIALGCMRWVIIPSVAGHWDHKVQPVNVVSLENRRNLVHLEHGGCRGESREGSLASSWCGKVTY